MNECNKRWFIAWAVLGGLWSATLLGQQTIYVNDGNNVMRPLRKIVDGESYYFDSGKYIKRELGGDPPLFVVRPANEYLPLFITVNYEKGRFSYLNSDHLNKLERRFIFRVAFSSDYKLKNPFFALEFKNDRGAKRPLVRELQTEELEQSRPISFDGILPPEEYTDEEYELHVFSDGLEIFHTGMSRSFIEETLAKMVIKRILNVQNASPKPFTGPIPHYPEKLRETRITGHAVIACVIAANGGVQEPHVKAASDPAFGEAALAVMPQWWFLPKVENGRAIASRAELPFDFAPPKS